MMTNKDLKEIEALLSGEGDNTRILKKIKKELTPIKVRSAKAKGMNFQRYVCSRLSEYSGIPWGSGDDVLIASRPAGQHGTDIILRGEAKNAFNYATECKAQESFSMQSTIDQVQANLGDFKNWIIFHKKVNKSPVVIIDMEHFMELYFNRVNST